MALLGRYIWHRGIILQSVYLSTSTNREFNLVRPARRQVITYVYLQREGDRERAREGEREGESDREKMRVKEKERDQGGPIAAPRYSAQILSDLCPDSKSQ
jgi:hypothetical protein